MYTSKEMLGMEVPEAGNISKPEEPKSPDTTTTRPNKAIKFCWEEAGPKQNETPPFLEWFRCEQVVEETCRTLIRMNENKLEKIGIINSVHRQELMQHILRLRLRHESLDLKNLDQKGSGFELPLPDSKHQASLKEKKDKR